MCRQQMPYMRQRLDQAVRAMLAKRVWWGRKARRVLPVGPVRCLATITSAVPASFLQGCTSTGSFELPSCNAVTPREYSLGFGRS